MKMIAEETKQIKKNLDDDRIKEEKYEVCMKNQGCCITIAQYPEYYYKEYDDLFNTNYYYIPYDNDDSV